MDDTVVLKLGEISSEFLVNALRNLASGNFGKHVVFLRYCEELNRDQEVTLTIDEVADELIRRLIPIH